MARAISFEYLNRQLVWHELSELLLFVLPLVNVTRVKRMISNRWPSLRAATGTSLLHSLLAYDLWFEPCADVLSTWQDICSLRGLEHREPNASNVSYSTKCLKCLIFCAMAAAKHLQRASGVSATWQDDLGTRNLPGPCAICSAQDIVVPFQSVPCGHVFCYYCLRTNCEADQNFMCPHCSVKVFAMKRFYPKQQ